MTNEKMKVCIVQPPYSANYSDSDTFFAWEMEAFEKCDESMDLIVFPESTDVPAFAENNELHRQSYRKYNEAILKKASETAKRCNSILFINALYDSGEGLRNTTYAFNRQGEQVGLYFKQHPTNGEVFKRKLDCAYSYEFSAPTVIEIEDLRFCFLTCYDFYFYEAFPNIARQRPDIIIGCSHQRTDRQDAIETMCKFLAYNTNAYVVRASVSMGEDLTIGGGSMVVSPDGRTVTDMRARVGLECCEIYPHQKYTKPAGFGGPEIAHHEYIEVGRRPWKYRPAGSAIVLNDELKSYPRVCAHRGFNTVAPENSMPAFGAAVALGATEIEFDIWPTKDGELVSIHDSKLDRVSNGTGKVWDHTLEELQKLDFGKGFDGAYSNLQVVKFEDILKKFACHVIMNIHVKTRDNVSEYDSAMLKKIVDTIEKYDCKEYVYIMSGNDVFQRQIAKNYPDIRRCLGGGSEKARIVERAIELGCYKLQFFKPYVSKEMVDLAHAHGILCNVFWSDDPEEAKQFIEMGIDTILTNDYHRISDALKIK